MMARYSYHSIVSFEWTRLRQEDECVQSLREMWRITVIINNYRIIIRASYDHHHDVDEMMEWC